MTAPAPPVSWLTQMYYLTGDKKSNTGLDGLKIKMSAGLCFLSGGFLPFSSFYKLQAFLGLWPLPASKLAMAR